MKTNKQILTYKEIRRFVDFDGWYKIELERSDGKITKVNKKRFRQLLDANKISK